MNRRLFLAVSASGLAGLVFWRYGKRQAIEAAIVPAGPAKMVKIVEFSDTGKRLSVVSVPKIVKSDEEWRKATQPRGL
jgi:hypothetical protein